MITRVSLQSCSLLQSEVSLPFAAHTSLFTFAASLHDIQQLCMCLVWQQIAQPLEPQTGADSTASRAPDRCRLHQERRPGALHVSGDSQGFTVCLLCWYSIIKFQGTPILRCFWLGVSITALTVQSNVLTEHFLSSLAKLRKAHNSLVSKAFN